MLVFMIEDQTHRATADLRRELVARIAHDGSSFSGVGASGKPGAVQVTITQRETQIPAHRLDDQPSLEVVTFEVSPDA
jgi:hypothetical protein